MKANNIRIFIVLISILSFSLALSQNVSAGLLGDYSTTSAGGNLAPATFNTVDWVSDVHFAVYFNGDPIAGESGFQDFGPPYDITTCRAIFFPAGCLPGSPDPTSSITVNAGEFLYVYQIDHDVNAATTLTKLNVGLFDSAKDSVTSIGFTNDTNVDIFALGSGTNGPDKAVYSDVTRSAAYNFMSDVVQPGNKSYTLFFTSTEAPTFHSSSLFGNSADTQLLPSPMVPEPVSSVLFIAGAATLGFRRFRKSKNV